jgi:hypothetical protein
VVGRSDVLGFSASGCPSPLPVPGLDPAGRCRGCRPHQVGIRQSP